MQRGMRTELVVPDDVQSDFNPHSVEVERNNDPARAFSFQGTDEPFSNGNTAMFADGAETRGDAFSLAPDMIGVVPRLANRLGARRPELCAFVRNNVLWFLVSPDCLVENTLNLFGRRGFFEKSKTDASAGKMVYNDEYPPAERPFLNQ